MHLWSSYLDGNLAGDGVDVEAVGAEAAEGVLHLAEAAAVQVGRHDLPHEGARRRVLGHGESVDLEEDSCFAPLHGILCARGAKLRDGKRNLATLLRKRGEQYVSCLLLTSKSNWGSLSLESATMTLTRTEDSTFAPFIAFTL